MPKSIQNLKDEIEIQRKNKNIHIFIFSYCNEIFTNDPGLHFNQEFRSPCEIYSK